MSLSTASISRSRNAIRLSAACILDRQRERAKPLEPLDRLTVGCERKDSQEATSREQRFRGSLTLPERRSQETRR
jgi:hypothetical protein